MSKVLKVWLWIVFIANIVSGAICVVAAIYEPTGWLNVALEVLLVAGSGLLLFKQKKLGFYLLCASSVLGMIVNIAIAGSNPVSAIISGIILPLIIFLLMRKTWDQFE